MPIFKADEWREHTLVGAVRLTLFARVESIPRVVERRATGDGDPVRDLLGIATGFMDGRILFRPGLGLAL